VTLTTTWSPTGSPVPRKSIEHSIHLDILADEEDGEEFEIPDLSDEPDVQFLRGSMSVDELSIQQSNGSDLYFDLYGDQERLLKAKKNVRLLAKEATNGAMKTDPDSPSTPIH
jgi:hypothetical protein